MSEAHGYGDAEFIEDDEDDLGPPDETPPALTDREEKERRARAQGWHPLTEYRGPRHLWRDVDEFLRHGEENLPILRQQNRRLADELAAQGDVVARQGKQLADQAKALDGLRKLATRASEQGYERAMSDLKAQRRVAAQSGDDGEVERISEQIDVLSEERATVTAEAEPAPEPEPARNGPPPAPPEMQAFFDANPWWNVDRQLSDAMIAAHRLVMAKSPNLPLGDQLAEARRRIVAEFPEKFPGETRSAAPEPEPEFEIEEEELPMSRAPEPRRAVAAPVSRPTGGGGGAPAGPRRSKWDVIADPAEREECKAAFASIKNSQPDYTVDEYLAVYQNPKADVIAIRREAAKRAAHGRS